MKVSDWYSFRTNQIHFEICIRTNRNSSDSDRMNFWCELVEKISNLIRMNPDQFFNPNKSEIGIIRIGNSVKIILTLDPFGFLRRQRLGLTRIKSRFGLKVWDSIGLIFNRFASTRSTTFFGLTRMSLDTDFGMNWYKYDSFGMNPNPKLLPGFSPCSFFVQSGNC